MRVQLHTFVWHYIVTVITLSHWFSNWRVSISGSDCITKLLQVGPVKSCCRVWKVTFFICLLPCLSWKLLQLCEQKQNWTGESLCVLEFWHKFKLVFLCVLVLPCCDELSMLKKFLIMPATPIHQRVQRGCLLFQQPLLLKFCFILIAKIYFTLLFLAKIYQFSLCRLLVFGTYVRYMENTFPLWYIYYIYTFFTILRYMRVYVSIYMSEYHSYKT